MLNLYLSKKYESSSREDISNLTKDTYPVNLYKFLVRIANSLDNVCFIGERERLYIIKEKNKYVRYGSYNLVMPIKVRSNRKYYNYLERRQLVLKMFCDVNTIDKLNDGNEFSIHDYIQKYNFDCQNLHSYMPSIYEYGYIHYNGHIISAFVIMKQYNTFCHIKHLETHERIVLCHHIIEFYKLLKQHKLCIRDFKIENIGFEVVHGGFQFKIIDYDIDTIIYNNQNNIYETIKDYRYRQSSITKYLSQLVGFYYIPYSMVINYHQLENNFINHQNCLNMDRLSLGIILFQVLTLREHHFKTFSSYVLDNLKTMIQEDELNYDEIKFLYKNYRDFINSIVNSWEEEVIELDSLFFNIFIKMKFLIDDCLTPYSFSDSYYEFEDSEMSDVLENYYLLSESDDELS